MRVGTVEWERDNRFRLVYAEVSSKKRDLEHALRKSQDEVEAIKNAIAYHDRVLQAIHDGRHCR